MKVIIDFEGFDEGSQAASVLMDWIEASIKDKTLDNITPLRHADGAEIMKEG